MPLWGLPQPNPNVGDVIRLRETALTKSVAVINEITTPVLGVYSLYSIFDDFSN